MDTERVPRSILDNEEGSTFLRMLITKKMAIRGMKLTQYDRDKTSLCIIVIRSTTNKFIKTQDVLSYNDEYWHHLHVHYDGKDKYPDAITNIKLVYALQDKLRVLEELSKSQKDGLKIWENKDNWNSVNPTRFGNVAVRNSSRCLITKDIDVNQLINKIAQQISASTSDESEELASNESAEFTLNEPEESTSDKPEESH
ncbi:unnamed protein product [Rotaria sp. Silwood2]|nr:unnamed protein product [Rotaria sp. Silwood2]CAF3961081.1 unnamed protein product [Rotaria sp. Silwood2]CAF3967243.1 unnamed protein product [Rotaria sp. Silwood2]